jgi:hypothetical protein
VPGRHGWTYEVDEKERSGQHFKREALKKNWSTKARSRGIANGHTFYALLSPCLIHDVKNSSNRRLMSVNIDES